MVIGIDGANWMCKCFITESTLIQSHITSSCAFLKCLILVTLYLFRQVNIACSSKQRRKKNKYIASGLSIATENQKFRK